MTRIIRSLLRVLPILALSITINAEDFAEMTLVPHDPNQPATPFNEIELLGVIDGPINQRSPAILEDRTASPYHLDKKSPAMLKKRDPDPYPNGPCPRYPDYRDHEDDTECQNQLKLPPGSEEYLEYASRGSLCSVDNRRRSVDCQMCYGTHPYGGRHEPVSLIL